MAYQLSPALERLIRQQMASGRYASEEQLLFAALESLQAEDEELRAIEEGLQSVDDGDDGVSVDEAFDRLREKYRARD